MEETPNYGNTFDLKVESFIRHIESPYIKTGVNRYGKRDNHLAAFRRGGGFATRFHSGKN